MIRGSGRTSQQIKDAPQRAVFVWPVCGSLQYAKDLARHLGREDLKIVSLYWLEPRHWHACELSGIVLDHASSERMNEREWYWYHQAQTRIRAPLTIG